MRRWRYRVSGGMEVILSTGSRIFVAFIATAFWGMGMFSLIFLIFSYNFKIMSLLVEVKTVMVLFRRFTDEIYTLGRIFVGFASIRDRIRYIRRSNQ